MSGAPLPTVGRVILYTLSQEDADAINRRRTTGVSIAERISQGTWPVGAQAHIGNLASEGDVLPGMVVRVWGDAPGNMINAKIELDGTDQFWATSRNYAEVPTKGCWHWMPYQLQQAAKNA